MECALCAPLQNIYIHPEADRPVTSVQLLFDSEEEREQHVWAHFDQSEEGQWAFEHVAVLCFPDILNSISESFVNEDNQHQCLFCDAIFLPKYEYYHIRRHVDTCHRGLLPWQCPICLRRFSRKDKMINHHSLHNTSPLETCYYCDLCPDRFFQTREQFTKHQRVHNDPVFCIYCSQSFKRIDSMKTHYKSQHPGMEIPDAPLQQPRQDIQPVRKKTVKKSPDPNRKLRRRKAKPGEWRRKCPFCDKDFAQASNLQQHLKRMHVDLVENCRSFQTTKEGTKESRLIEISQDSDFHPEPLPSIHTSVEEQTDNSIGEGLPFVNFAKKKRIHHIERETATSVEQVEETCSQVHLCGHCRKEFDSIPEWENHFQRGECDQGTCTVENERITILLCYCGEEFEDTASLEEHRLSQHNTATYYVEVL